MKNIFFYTMAAAAALFLTAACDDEIRVTSVTITPSSTVTLIVGETATFTATVSPPNASEQTIYWGSGKSEIATVDQNGNVRAISRGETYIVVSTKAEARWDRCSLKVISPPTAPANFKAAPNSWNSVSLSWDYVTDATGYNIYRSSSANGEYEEIGNRGSSNTSYTDFNPLPGGGNYYKVTSVYSAGESQPSDYATGSPPNTPAGFRGYQYSTYVSLSWNNVDRANFNVYRSSSENGGYVLIRDATSLTSISDYAPNTGNNYYRVTAIGPFGESPPSNSVNFVY